MGAIVLLLVLMFAFSIICPIAIAIDWNTNYKNKMTFKEYLERM